MLLWLLLISLSLLVRASRVIFEQNITLVARNNSQGKTPSDVLLRLKIDDSPVRVCSIFCVTHLVSPAECILLLRHVSQTVTESGSEQGLRSHRRYSLLHSLIVDIHSGHRFRKQGRIETPRSQNQHVVHVPVFEGSVLHADAVSNTICEQQVPKILLLASTSPYLTVLRGWMI